MSRQYIPAFMWPQKADIPHVIVHNGDLEGALRILRRRVNNCGTSKALKIRKAFPAPRARKRARRLS